MNLRLSRKAFTLLELLAVVSILAVLIGILFLGLRSVTNSGRDKQTRITLQNLKSMLVEYEQVTKFKRKPAQWEWRGLTGSPAIYDSTLPLPAPPADEFPRSLDFWRAAYRWDSDTSGSLDGTDQADGIDAPGNVTEESDGSHRHGSRAVLNTQLAMGLIGGVAANASAMRNLPPSQIFTPKWISGNVTGPDPGPDGVVATIDPSSTDDTAPSSVVYVVGNRVTNGGTNFRCNTAHDASTPPSPPTRWDIDTSTAPNYLLLDAWNNPIIFVPGGGLVGVKVGDTIHKRNNPIKSDDGKPFFVSAGADGDFRTGDDNIYSFKN